MTAYVPPYRAQLSEDNNIRKDSSLASYAKLKPAFDRKHGSVTAANSTPLTDGAAAVLMMSESRAKELGLQPLGYLRSFAFAAIDVWEDMLLGPSYATPLALDRAGIGLADLTLIDMHEAFAAQTLANLKMFASEEFAREKLGRSQAIGEVDMDKFNVLGGSIAYGHPFAATGARMITQTLHELKRRGGGLGLTTACAAGGLGGRDDRGGGMMSFENALHEQRAKPSAFQLTIRPDNIGVITIDVPGDKVNTLKAEFVEQVNDVLIRAQQHTALEGLVIVSGKPDSFIAGADITMIAACTSAKEAETLAKKGQSTLAQIAAFPVPVVAAIHGACLGGGLELALACHGRVCSLDDKTALGLPEVQLGLLPGSGGTQRLPRLVGAAKALDMILTGKHIRARQALRMGLVDDAVPQSILLQTAIERVKQGWKHQRELPWQDRLLNGPLGRNLLFSIVRKKTLAKTHGNYPAAERIIQVVRTGLDHGSASGYEAEARAFGELAMTPQSAALRSLFFASTALKKERGGNAQPRALHRVGILGGGLMGGGIACVTATRGGLPVRIKDINETGINHALKYSWDVLGKRVRSKRMRPAERQKQMMLISGSTDYTGFEQVDVVVEAVFEDLALKQQMVAEVEANCAPHTVFASNTSLAAYRPHRRKSPAAAAGDRPALLQPGGQDAAGGSDPACRHQRRDHRHHCGAGAQAGARPPSWWATAPVLRQPHPGAVHQRSGALPAGRRADGVAGQGAGGLRFPGRPHHPCWMKWASTSVPRSSRYWSRRWGHASPRRLRSMRC